MEIDALRAWAVDVLVAVGLTEADARPVADSLAFAEARGVATHGLLRLPTYVERIRGGGINAAARVHTVADMGALVVLDADHAPGATSGLIGADLAIERAGRHGIGCIIAHNANHFGASGFFTNRIADADLLGLAVCNTEPVMCAPAGGRPVLGTNPIAVAVPMPKERRPQLDMATTTVSQGKLILADQAGEPIPVGWAVDAAGQPTTSPTAGLRGALLPSGGPKGFGLAFAVDALLALGAAEVSSGVSALNGDRAAHQCLGHLFLAIRADAAGSLSDYRARMTQLVDSIHGSGINHAGSVPMAPGEPELRRVDASDGRLQLGDSLLDALRPLAACTGVPLPVHDPSRVDSPSTTYS